MAREQAEREMSAECWSACVESFLVEVTAWRVECSFASGDLEGSVGDLTLAILVLRPQIMPALRPGLETLPRPTPPLQILRSLLHTSPRSRRERRLAKFDKALREYINPDAPLLPIPTIPTSVWKAGQPLSTTSKYLSSDLRLCGLPLHKVHSDTFNYDESGGGWVKVWNAAIRDVKIVKFPW
ncbi:hypothetical protein BDQ17DRAFT_1411190 [Cyathus striatus]|nr:hypothetical protein BDQ17DRAFT_1411190 [Cyathus striatus]